MFSLSAERVAALKALLHAKYKMTDHGLVRCFLGIEIECDRPNRILHIHARAIQKLSEIYGLSSCNGNWIPKPTGSRLRKLDSDSDSAKALDSAGQRRYQSIVGSLMWLMRCTRPDLAFTVSMFSKFSAAPTTEHLAAASYVLRYLRNTLDLAIQYNPRTQTLPAIQTTGNQHPVMCSLSVEVPYHGGPGNSP